jgi:hypothetical protein
MRQRYQYNHNLTGKVFAVAEFGFYVGSHVWARISEQDPEGWQMVATYSTRGWREIKQIIGQAPVGKSGWRHLWEGSRNLRLEKPTAPTWRGEFSKYGPYKIISPFQNIFRCIEIKWKRITLWNVEPDRKFHDLALRYYTKLDLLSWFCPAFSNIRVFNNI